MPNGLAESLPLCLIFKINFQFMRNIHRPCFVLLLTFFLSGIAFAQSITADFNSTPSSACASASGCNSFVWNISGTTFVFTFISTDPGGSMQWLASGGGVGGSGSMDLLSGTAPNLTTTEKLVITRQDGGSFNFNGIYIQNNLAQTATVQGYKNSATVNAPQSVANAVTSTLNFGGINVDKVEISSTDFFYLSIDNFSACITPLPSFTTNTVCIGSSTQFTDASTLVAAEATYAWDFDNNATTDNTTKGNVTNAYSSAGTYTAKLTITQGGCSNSTTSQVSVQEISSPPTVDAPLCSGLTSVSGTSSGADGTIITVYKAGNTQIGTASVSSGTWTATVSSLANGDVVTAKATESGKCQSVSSGSVSVSNPTLSTLTTLASSTNPSFTTAPNNSVTLTATVTSGGNPVTVGNVTFKDGATILGTTNVNGSGLATLNNNFTIEGNHNISAVYNANCPYGTSTGTMTQRVDNHTSISGSQFCNDLSGITLNTNYNTAPYPSNIFVSGLGSSINSLKVKINGFTNANPGQVQALLVGPAGQKIVLFSGAGGSTSVSNINLVIDDAAASQISSSSLSSGSFRPTAYNLPLSFPAPAPVLVSGDIPATYGAATLTSQFSGTNPNGTWSLFVVDINGSSGSITSWCLEISAAPRVTGITRLIPLNQNTNLNAVSYQVKFSVPVTGVDASDFSLFSTGGAVSGIIGTVSGSGDTYIVSVNNIAGDGDLRLNLNSSGTGIIDGISQAITGGFTAGETYIFDHTIPALSSVSITSNNIYSSSMAKVGDKITVLFTASEPIGTPTVTIHGQPASVSNVSGSQWKAEYTMQLGDAPEGSITFSIGFTDLAGNNGTNVTSVTDASGVTFDKTLPTLTAVHIQSNNVNTAKAKVGDIITVSFTISEPVVTVSAGIDGHPVAVTNISGNNYTASWTMTGTDPEGPVTFSIGAYRDPAGNVGATISAATDASSVTFDRTAPAVTINQAAGQADPTTASSIHFTVVFNETVTGFATGDVTLSGTAGATTATVTEIAPMNGTTYDVTVTGMNTNGTVIATVGANKAVDAAGNNNTASTSTDNTVNWVCSIICPDNITVTTGTGATQCGANVTFSVTTTCGATVTTTVNGNPVVSGNFFPVGTTTVTSTAAGAQCSFTITVNDNTPPVISCAAPTSATANITCQAAVPNVLGNVSVTDNCSASDNITLSQSPAAGTLVGLGQTTIIVTATDAVGNQSTCTTTFTVTDNTAPNFTQNPVATPQVIWPPDHRMKDVYLNNYAATDNCGGTVTYRINVSSNESTHGTSDGDRSPDWIVVDSTSPHPVHLQLRAERGNGRDARVYTITVIAIDAFNNEKVSQSTEVRIAHNITDPITGNSFRIGSTVNFAGVFWDKPGNKHTATWSIDDNTTVKATVTEPSGPKNGKVTGSYKFTTAGVYRLQMNVTDQNRVTSYCNTNEDQEAIVVIYDPNGGYTYGGGYFNSPAGALASDATVTGKANFGYTVNYYKGATLPKGETQFEFKVGDFQYNALNFDYLSVASPGYKAVFAGSGRIIGGISGVNFTMYVIDGALDGTGVDKVRLKIYNKNTGYIYYDNEPGKGETADPTTPVGISSSIVIGGTNTTAARTASPGTVEMISNLELRSYPNPSYSSFNVVIASTNRNDKVVLKVTDILGRVVEQKEVSPNQTINMGGLYRPGIYIVQAVQGKLVKEIKLNKIPD
jgi:hypothetical protein